MFIDIHGHAYRSCPAPNSYWRFSTPEELITRYDQIGIEKAVLLPLVNAEVYLPQSNEEILAITRDYADRFIPFCNIDPRALTNSADAPLGDLLRYYRDQGCKGIGEVMPNMAFRDPLVQNLFCHVAEVGFPLIFDISDRIGGDYGLCDDPGLPQLEESLKSFPDLTILGHGPAFWAEMGRLETPADRAGYPAYALVEEGVVPKLFRRYPNLYGDLSARSGYNALARDLGHAARFLNEFQDRLLFGTDICSPDQDVPQAELLEKFRDEGMISSQVFEKVAHKNARRLLNLH